MDRAAQKEEGRQKSDGHGMGERPSGWEGVRDAVFNHGVDPQLRIMERLEDMIGAAKLENFRTPLVADGREGSG